MLEETDQAGRLSVCQLSSPTSFLEASLPNFPFPLISSSSEFQASLPHQLLLTLAPRKKGELGVEKR